MMVLWLQAASSDGGQTPTALYLAGSGVVVSAITSLLTLWLSRHRFRADAESIVVASAQGMIGRLENEVRTLVAGRKEDRKQIESLDRRVRRSEDHERECTRDLADAHRKIEDLTRIIERMQQ